jgi:hypothetical protein
MANAFALNDGRSESAPIAINPNAVRLPTVTVPQMSGNGLFNGPQGFMGGLGRIGDAFALAGGRTPVYRQTMEQDAERNAFGQLVQNPTDQNAFAALARVNPQAALQFQNQMQQQQGAQSAQAEKTRAQQLQAYTGAATALKRVRDSGGDVGAAFDQMGQAGVLDALGVDAGHRDALRASIVGDPKFLDTLVAPEKGVVVAGGGQGFVVDPTTGKPIFSTGLAPVKLGEGETLYGSPSGATAAPVGAQGSVPRGVRNNNEGNLRDGAFAKAQPGYIGADSDGFARFASPQAGQVAQERLLMGPRYFGGGNNTVNSIVDTYLGKGSENSPEAKANYKAFVAQKLGVAPDAVLSGQQVRPLAAAMRQFETGSGNSGNASPSSMQVLAKGNESVPLKGNALDLAAQMYLQYGQMPQLGMGKQAAANRTALLNRAAELSGVSNPAAMAGNIGQNKQNFAAQQQTLKAFSSGPEARSVRSFNTAIDHLGTLSELANALGNGNIPVVNSIAQKYAKQTGEEAPTNFDAAKQIIGQEIIKAIVANGGGQAEREEAGAQLSRANSPKQLVGVANTYKKLMGGQLKSLQLQYEQGTGRKDFTNRLTPAAQQELQGKPSVAPVTATGPGGKKVQWNGKGWVPFNG